MRRERFQIRAYAGAARRIEPCDGQKNWWNVGDVVVHFSPVPSARGTNAGSANNTGEAGKEKCTRIFARNASVILERGRIRRRTAAVEFPRRPCAILREKSTHERRICHAAHG